MTPGAGGGLQATVAPVQLPAPPNRVQGTDEIPPGWAGFGALTVPADGDVGRYEVIYGGLIDELSATLATAGSSSSVFTAYVNGASIGTVTLASSDTAETDPITPVRVVPGDLVHMRPTTAGTGAKGGRANLVIKR